MNVEIPKTVTPQWIWSLNFRVFGKCQKILHHEKSQIKVHKNLSIWIYVIYEWNIIIFEHTSISVAVPIKDNHVFRNMIFQESLKSNVRPKLSLFDFWHFLAGDMLEDYNRGRAKNYHWAAMLQWDSHHLVNWRSHFQKTLSC